MSPEPRPTSLPSGISIHPAVYGLATTLRRQLIACSAFRVNLIKEVRCRIHEILSIVGKSRRP